MPMKLTSTIEGDTTGDLEVALEEVQRLVAERYTSGSDRNDTGRYEFSIEGDGRGAAGDAAA
jgi:hypothetical protein